MLGRDLLSGIGEWPVCIDVSDEALESRWTPPAAHFPGAVLVVLDVVANKVSVRAEYIDAVKAAAPTVSDVFGASNSVDSWDFLSQLLILTSRARNCKAAAVFKQCVALFGISAMTCLH